MNLNPLSLLKTIWERDRSGNNWYLVDGVKGWGYKGTNLWKAQNHPILTPAMLFVSKLYSQGKITIVDTRTDKPVLTHPLLKAYKKPNFYQTSMDFQESMMFMMLAQGKAVAWVKKSVGLGNIMAIHLLDSDLIEWPEDFKTLKKGPAYDSVIGKQKIMYDRNNQKIEIAINDLLFFYDLPNCLQKNMFEVSSRLDGLDQTLINTCDSLLAKNIILKTNGKEMISQKKAGFPLGEDEKQEAEKMFNNKFGLGAGRSRGLVTRADLTWQSMHIALRDLGLDDSVKVDGNLIYTALHIPKDILSLEAKKTTYNNFKESMVSYIQNEIQPSADAAAAVMQKLIPEDYLEIRISYDHLPIMQFILLEFYEGKIKLGTALTGLRNAGIPDEDALKLLKLDPSIKLNPLVKTTTNESSETNTEGGETETNSED